MIKKIISIVLVFCIISVFLCACKGEEDIRKDSYFAKLSMNDKCDYVENYLKTQYNVETTVDNVAKRSNGALGSEELYFAIAQFNETERIYCWVDDNGFIQDSHFINALSKDIQSMFDEKVVKIVENYTMICDVTLQNAPKATNWTADTIKEMLSQEDVNVSIRIFLNESQRNDVNEYLFKEIKDEFGFTKGTCYFYFVESEKEIEMSIDNLVNFDVSTDFGND